MVDMTSIKPLAEILLGGGFVPNEYLLEINPFLNGAVSCCTAASENHWFSL
jgi:hypothetical protein